MSYDFTADSKHRVIVNTDAKNEADDQFAIVHALLTPAFEIHGIIPAHFGDAKSATRARPSRNAPPKIPEAASAQQGRGDWRLEKQGLEPSANCGSL